MKRLLILLIATGLVCTFPTTALAGKPDKPPKPDPTETVMVTMSYQDAGIATTCGGELPMVRSSPDFLRADWGPQVPDVKMNLPPYLTGCHGGLVEGSADGFAGMFILDGQNDGTVRLFSRFDYEWQYEPHPRNPRKTVQSLLDLYEIDGILSGDFDWSNGGGTLTGLLLVRNFHKVYGDGEWTDLGTTPVSITIEW